MSRKKNLLFRVLFILVTILLLAISVSTFVINSFKSKIKIPPSITNVSVVEVTQSSFVGAIKTSGFIGSDENNKLFVLAGGKIENIYVKAGQSVKKGQVLARLDNSSEQSNISALKASLSSAQLNANGVAELYRAGGASKLQFEQAQAQVKQVQAQIEAALVATKSKIIVAPYDGVIGTVNVSEGELVTSATTVFTINSLNAENLFIDVSVTPNVLRDLSVGNFARIVDENGFVLSTGKITAIDSTINQTTGQSKVHVEIVNKAALTSGQFVRVELSKNSIEGQLIIPEIAVNYSVYGETVFKLSPLSDEDKSKLRDTLFANDTDKVRVDKSLNEIYKISLAFIKSSERFNDTALVTSGLKVGDIIVTQPDNLMDGSYVRVTPGFGLGIPNTFKLPDIAVEKKSK